MVNTIGHIGCMDMEQRKWSLPNDKI